MRALHKSILLLTALLPMASYPQSSNAGSSAAQAGTNQAGSNKDNPITGTAAYADWSQQKPGIFRKITVADMPQPHATESVDNGPDEVGRPECTMPQGPARFK